MKTAITKIMYIIETEHNNGVEISQRVLWKMLNEAKETEKRQIIEAFDAYAEKRRQAITTGEQYYESTFKNDEKNF